MGLSVCLQNCLSRSHIRDRHENRFSSALFHSDIIGMLDFPFHSAMKRLHVLSSLSIWSITNRSNYCWKQSKNSESLWSGESSFLPGLHGASQNDGLGKQEPTKRLNTVRVQKSLEKCLMMLNIQGIKNVLEQSDETVHKKMKLIGTPSKNWGNGSHISWTPNSQLSHSRLSANQVIIRTICSD